MNERKLRIPTDSIRISRHLVVWQSEQWSQIQTPHMPGARTTTLLVTPGNGTQTGSQALASLGFPVVGVAPTIDNDLYGSDITIGVDTALSIALEAVAGKIRSAYERAKPHALVVAAEGTRYNAPSSTSPARRRSGTGRLARPAAR